MWRKTSSVVVFLLLSACLLLGQIVTSSGGRAYVLCYIPLGKPALSRLLVEGEQANPFAIRDALFLHGSPVALKAGDTLVFNQGGVSLRVFDGGGFVYDSIAFFGPWDEWRGGSMHAGQLMQDYVLRTGGFPAELEFEERVVHRQGIFVTGYTFVFRQFFKGYPALGYGGLRITLGDGVLVHMTRSLYRSLGAYDEATAVISARQALSRALQYIDTEGRAVFIHGVRLGYFTPRPEVAVSILEPVWEVKLEGQSLYIGARTGELLRGDGAR
jgi:hypothetical protein